MINIIAFGASNSRNSINKQFAGWVSAQMEATHVLLLDLNDYEMPIYSIDREKEDGIPEKARLFKSALNQADGVLISFAEHNGSYTSAFKNIFDWVSRIGRPIWSNKPMFLLSTSPGGRGGKGVLTHAIASFPHQGGRVVASFSLPSFRKNFHPDQGILDQELQSGFNIELEKFQREIM